MKKPNAALSYMAAALSSQKKALSAKSAKLRAFHQMRAKRNFALAAKCKDAGKAVQIIQASNKLARARRLAADFDELPLEEDVALPVDVEDTVIVDDFDDIDDVYADAEEDDGAEEEEEADAEEDDGADADEEVDAEDEEESDDGEDDEGEDDAEDNEEVDSAILRVLSRNRRAKSVKAAATARRAKALKAARARALKAKARALKARKVRASATASRLARIRAKKSR